MKKVCIVKFLKDHVKNELWARMPLIEDLGHFQFV